VVFNIAGRGYFVSVHFDRLPDRSRIQLASAVAQWLKRQTRIPAARPHARGGRCEVHGPSHARDVVEWLTAQFPDLEMTIESLVAEADMVAVRVRASGTNRGRLGGFAPPTNKRFVADQSHWYRVADGRLYEHRATRAGAEAWRFRSNRRTSDARG